MALSSPEFSDTNSWQKGSCDWNCAFINHFDLAQLHDRLQAARVGFNADSGLKLEVFK